MSKSYREKNLASKTQVTKLTKLMQAEEIKISNNLSQMTKQELKELKNSIMLCINPEIETERKYNTVSCGNILGKEESDKLPGALAAFQDFFYTDTEKDAYGPEGVFNHSSVAAFIPNESDIRTDYSNNIFIGDAGAVVDAFDLSSFPENVKQRAIKEIINERKLMYPDYDFAMLPGAFPISVEGGLTTCGVCMREPSADMSSHILYIKDYEKHIVSDKNKNYKK